MKTTISSIIKKLLLLFLIFGGLYYAKAFLMPITIALVIATLFLPFCRWMEAKKIPKWLAVLICIITIFLFIFLLGALFGWQISSIASDFELLKQKAIEKGILLQLYIFDNLGIAVAKQSQILKTEQPSIASIIEAVLGSIKYVFINFIIVLTYIYMFLYYRGHIRNFLIKITPVSQKKEIEQVINSSTRVAQQYLIGLAKMIGCLWLMYGVGFGLVGVHNFAFFAILCGLLEIIPYIGNITGITLTLLLAAMHGASLPILLGILVTYGIAQFIQGWLLEPIILGPQVKINPLFTILALVLGELVWGTPGIILAIPIIAMLKIVCDYVEPLKPFGFLIGEIEIINKKSNFIIKLKQNTSTK